MKKISAIKNKINFENIFILYIMLQPIIDIITSLCVRNVSNQLSIGIFARAIFMVCIIIYTLIKVDKKSKWQLIIYYLCTAVYFAIFLINSYTKYGFSMIFVQIKGLVKTFYLPIILVTLLILFKQDKYSTKRKYLNIALFIYVLTIVICNIFSVGYPTYPLKENVGTIGLFYAGNEIGAIIAMLSPICFATFISQKFSFIHAILCALTIYSMLEIGTKVACISAIILIFISLILVFIKFITDKNFSKQFATIALITLLTILFIGNTSAGKNLGIDPIFSAKKNISNTVKKNKPKKKEKTPSSLLSGRNKFFKDNIDDYSQSSLMDKAFGMGYISLEDDEVQERKLVEIDYFDVFFCQGIVGTIIYIIPLATIAFISLKRFFAKFIINIKNHLLTLTIYSVLIGLGIALMAGHVFTAPAVSTVLVLIILELIAILYEKDTKNE